MRNQTITTFFLFAFLVMFFSLASAVSLEEDYLSYPKGGLMFKLPAGNWEVLKKVPAPFDAFNVGTKPDVVLAARIRPALIQIWVKPSSRDYSDNLVKAYEKLENILKNRRKAAWASKNYQYFEYELLSGVPAARSMMAAEAEDLRVQGQGEARIYFHKGKTYFQYFELLADSDVFEAVKEEFSEAMKETRAH